MPLTLQIITPERIVFSEEGVESVTLPGIEDATTRNAPMDAGPPPVAELPAPVAPPAVGLVPSARAARNSLRRLAGTTTRQLELSRRPAVQSRLKR